MDLLKKIWPISFSQAKGEKDVFIIRLIVYIVAIVAVNVISAVVGMILGGGVLQIIASLVALVAGIIDLYCVAGIVFLILRFVGVFK